MLRQRSRAERPVVLLLAREEMAVENNVLMWLALFRLVWAREKATENSRAGSVRQLACKMNLLLHGSLV